MKWNVKIITGQNFLSVSASTQSRIKNRRKQTHAERYLVTGGGHGIGNTILYKIIRLRKEWELN